MQQQPGAAGRSRAATAAAASCCCRPPRGCIFCSIIKQDDELDRPARLIYSDEHVVALHDIKPAASVHLLVLPRRHVPNVTSLAGADAALGETCDAAASAAAARKDVHSANTVLHHCRSPAHGGRRSAAPATAGGGGVVVIVRTQVWLPQAPVQERRPPAVSTSMRPSCCLLPAPCISVRACTHSSTGTAADHRRPPLCAALRRAACTASCCRTSGGAGPNTRAASIGSRLMDCSTSWRGCRRRHRRHSSSSS